MFWQKITASTHQWWHGRQPREKALLIIAALLLIFYIGYGKLIGPLSKNIKQQSDLRVYTQQQLPWLNRAWDKLQAYKKAGWHVKREAPLRMTEQQLIAQLTSSIARAKLDDFVTSIAAAKTGVSAGNQKQAASKKSENIHIVFKTIPFEQMKRWLFNIAQKDKLLITQIDLKKSQPEGTVTGSIDVGY